jgi:hypothetical protein
MPADNSGRSSSTRTLKRQQIGQRIWSEYNLAKARNHQPNHKLQRSKQQQKEEPKAHIKAAAPDHLTATRARLPIEIFSGNILISQVQETTASQATTP